MQRAYLHGAQGKMLKSSSFTRDGQDYLTCEFVMTDVTDGRLDTTVFDGRVYTIVMIYPTGHAGSGDIDEFFNSFHLVARPPAAEGDRPSVISTSHS
jgi:hypothetical protein